MKLLKTLREEIVPLSSKQSLILGIIIACLFQFVLFYAPALADNAVKQTQTNNHQNSATNNSTTPIILESKNASSTGSLRNPGQVTDEELAAQKLADELTKAESGPKVLRTSVHPMTAYNSDPRQTDDTPCITANSFNVCEHGVEDTIAANFLKFGTKVMIPELFGDRIFIVRDRMNKRYPDRVDIWMKSYDDAIQFGVRRATIQVIE